MTFDAQRIFLPSTGVDLVLDIDSDTPRSRSSIIYDADHKKNTMTIAQTNPPVTRNTRFKQAHLTVIIHTDHRTARVGIPCRPVKLIKHYPLANRAVAQALVLRYCLPVKETNIRNAFRFTLSLHHSVKGKLLYNGQEFSTDKDFKIKDISFTGLGIVVFREKAKKPAGLSTLPPGTSLAMGISLIDCEAQAVIATFPIQIKVVRVNHNYSDSHILIGVKIQDMTPANEDTLIKFIHNAQITELKRISKKG